MERLNKIENIPKNQSEEIIDYSKQISDYLQSEYNKGKLFPVKDGIVKIGDKIINISEAVASGMLSDGICYSYCHSTNSLSKTRPNKQKADSETDLKEFVRSGFLFSISDGTYAFSKKVSLLKISLTKVSSPTILRNLKLLLEIDEEGKVKSILPYSNSLLIKKNEDESNENYLERIRPFHGSGRTDLFINYQENLLKKKTGVDFTQLNFREKINLTNYLIRRKENENFYKFVKNSKEVGLKTFLACEFGGNQMGDKIIAIANKLENSPEHANLLFSEYVKFSDRSNEIAKSISFKFKKLFNETISAELIYLKLNKRALRLINESHERINDESSDENRVKIIEEVILDFQKEIKSIEKRLTEIESIIGVMESGQNAVSSNEKSNVHRKRLSRTLSELLTGVDSPILPKDFFIFSAEKEKIPANKSVYFPVGISSNLEQWNKVFEGQSEFSKPVDIYGYLLWMENLSTPVDLVVCDTIQANNFIQLYNMNEFSARKQAIKIGKKEMEFYKKVIQNLGLKNINLISYENFLNENSKKGLEYYREVCNVASKNSAFEAIFLNMIQDSVSNRSDRSNTKDFLPYAIEELSWVMATDKLKISHPNEARYDIIASILKNLEKIAVSNNKDIQSILKNQQELEDYLAEIISGLNDNINSKKAKTKKSSSTFDYYAKAQDFLKKIKLKNRKSNKSNAVNFEFICSENIDSQSFGWRNAREEEGVVKFKEPYSTYFFENDTELFLDSDQIVASPDGHIAGKILALEKKQQLKYAEKVLKPLIRNYYTWVNSLPTDHSYFVETQKNKSELMEECMKNETIYDLLQFIQDKIVKPSRNKSSMQMAA